MNQDISGTANSLIEGVTKAWDQLLQQLDDFLGWSAGTGPSMRRPSEMADGELRAALRAVASGLIDATGAGGARGLRSRG